MISRRGAARPRPAALAQRLPQRSQRPLLLHLRLLLRPPPLLLLLPLLLGPGRRAWGGEAPGAGASAGPGVAGRLTLGWESAAGTREARPLAERGLEQRLRLRYQALDRLALVASGGLLFGATDGAHGPAYAVEATARLLDGTRSPLVLDVGGGAGVDYRGDALLRLRLAGERAFGRLALGASGLVERPLAAGRDAVDLIVGATASIALSPGARLGLEASGQDLEGLWDDEEADGGAALLVGPTAAFTLPNSPLSIGATGAVVLAVGQRPTGGPPLPSPGLQARLTLGYAF